MIGSLAHEVRVLLQLSPRQLPSFALYDPLGSFLFEAICRLPWYPVTRAEQRLLSTSRIEILDAVGRPSRLVELGPGNGDKLNMLLGPADEARASGVRHVDLVDVSITALEAAARLLTAQRSLSVGQHAQRYEDGIVSAAAARPPGQRLCVLFLGSNIGNFDPPADLAFLRTIRGALMPGDAIVIGADLIKPESTLMLAYDDPLGVTAAFNKNLLVHLNRELDATFDVASFDHRAVWNAEHSRVEMHLVSRARQSVELPKAELAIELAKGEPIWTESSYKYDADAFADMLQVAGFSPRKRWIDRAGQFALLAAVADGLTSAQR
jgi:dimethylhistidine N-methyltransferase